MRGTLPIWLLLRIDQDGLMATKIAIKKGALTRYVPAQDAAPTKKADQTKTTGTKAKPRTIGSTRLSRSPNAESRQALAELKSGKLTRYTDTADMFKKLGIKVGKA